jgi:transposase
MMKRFIQGEHRTQSTLLPEMLDDYVTAENPVRVIDVFVDNLDLKQLGFEGVTPAVTGRLSYHPAVMLKLYICGYLNRVQSSRRLERETQHRYWTNECKNCPLKDQCTPGNERRVSRWENEAVLDEMQRRPDIVFQCHQFDFCLHLIQT